MIEKRFVYIEHKGADYILDTPNWELDFIEMLGDCLEAEEIVHILNEQYETIIRKNKQINYLKRVIYNNEPKIFVQAVFDDLEKIG